MMDTTLSCDSTDKLFGAFAEEFIFPNVDWQRACKDAMKRIADGRAEYRAEQEAREQERDDQIRAETQDEDESVDETPKSDIARRPKWVEPTTLYGLRNDHSATWFSGNESQMLDGGPDVRYTPTFLSEEDARQYMVESQMPEGVSNHRETEESYTIMPLEVIGRQPKFESTSTDPTVSRLRFDPAAFYLIRKANGDWLDNDCNEEPKVMHVYCLRTFDEAATIRLLLGDPDDEIVPLMRKTPTTDQLAQENLRLKQELAERSGQLADISRLFREYVERAEGDDETPEPELEPLPSTETLDASGAVVSAIEDELSWLNDQHVIDADNGRPVLANLRDFFKLIDRFDGSCRIRKSRPDDDEPRRRLIIENSTGFNVLPARAADQVIGMMVDRKLCQFDAAGALHVSDKARALFGMTGGA